MNSDDFPMKTHRFSPRTSPWCSVAPFQKSAARRLIRWDGMMGWWEYVDDGMINWLFTDDWHWHCHHWFTDDVLHLLIIDHHQPSSTIINHNQPSSTIIDHWHIDITDDFEYLSTHIMAFVPLGMGHGGLQLQRLLWDEGVRWMVATRGDGDTGVLFPLDQWCGEFFSGDDHNDHNDHNDHHGFKSK